MNVDVNLSIVVPIYNVEPYLSECLESILDGVRGFYEVILVNDGSTDESPEIAKSYVARFPELFKYFEQPNEGLSSARNKGLAAAKGKYIYFFDSDDVLIGGGLSALLDHAIQADVDVAVGSFVRFHEDGAVLPISRFLEVDIDHGKHWLQKSLYERSYQPEVWSKLYKREFLERHKLSFVPGLINEDQYFTPVVIALAQRLLAKNILLLRYRIREGSINTSANPQLAMRRIDANLRTVKMIHSRRNELFEGRLGELLLNHCVNLNRDGFIQAWQSDLSDDDQKVLSGVLSELDSLRLQSSFRLYRFGRLVDWLLLGIGFRAYARWRYMRRKNRLKN